MPHTIAIDARKVADFGIGTYIRSLVWSLAEIDAEDRFLLLVGPEGGELLAGLPPNFELVAESSRVYSGRELLQVAWRLWHLGADLYHATHYVLPLFVPGRAVVTIHDIIHLLYPDFLPNRLAFLYAQRMIRHALSRGDRIISVSQATRSDLVKHFEVAPERIEVIHNGVEERFAVPLEEEERNRRLAALGVEGPYLLFVGNPKPHKNLDRVVQAYARARELHAFDAPLVCVGGRGGGDFKVRQRAAQLGISDRIELLGFVADEDLPALYQGATLFLYPTLYEGFGLPVVEAMASGVPVITSDGSALREIAQGYAHLVDPLDVEQIAKAIAHCMADPEHRSSLVRLASKRAAELTWRRCAERTLRVYHSALGGGESR